MANLVILGRVFKIEISQLCEGQCVKYGDPYAIERSLSFVGRALEGA